MAKLAALDSTYGLGFMETARGGGGNLQYMYIRIAPWRNQEEEKRSTSISSFF
jgi:hypothetical protein